MIEQLEFYIVKSKDGKYFRSKGYGGYGKSWVDDPKDAKVYQKIGPARSQVTYWAGNYPEYGIPEIVVLTVQGTKVLNESDRVKKAIFKKAKEKFDRDLRYAKSEQKRIQEKVTRTGQIELQKAIEKVNKLIAQRKVYDD